MLRPIAYCLAASLALGSNLSHAQKTEPKLHLIYNANADLCTSAFRTLTSIHRRYPKANYIADEPKAFFSTPGFGEPHWLSKSDPAVVELGMGDPRFTRLDFADGQRLIAVNDIPLGSHGDFTTDVWIAKPGKNLAIRDDIKVNDDTLTSADPADVELLIDFERDKVRSSSPYPLVSLGKKTFSFDEGSPPNSSAIKSANDLFIGPDSQEPFGFKGRLYFLVGAAFAGPWTIYGFDKNAVPTMECIADFQ
ncbi:hypothetical protein DWV00_05195 [Trinickia dinghuensis]|uniref:Uncharacterized protein n=2 Tax=Trinickia dinghuensis TaxID=2291023 RepID=A0A3D8K5H7_9BURK|nr:hypothetical protein DWV00_05195 [Trinickia dinghuensis]